MSHVATVTVANNDGSKTLAKFRTLAVTIDHAALVSAKRSRVDGSDIRMRYGGRELNCWVDPMTANTSSCSIYFCAQAAISASGNDAGYELRWGNLDRQPHRVPRVAHSQMQTWRAAGTGTADSVITLPEEARLACPFWQFDDQRHRFTGGQHVPVTLGSIIDGTVYGASVSAVYGDPSDITSRGVFIDQSLTGIFALYRNDSAIGMPWRARGYMVFTLQPVGGVGWEKDATAFIMGGGFASLNASITTYAPTPVVRAGPAGAFALNTYTRFIIDYDPTTTPGTDIHRFRLPDLGVDLSWSDASQLVTPRFFTFLSAAVTASPGSFAGVRDISTEIWDTIDDTDVAVTVTIPALSLPDAPGFPFETAYNFPHPSIGYPEFPIGGVGVRPQAGINRHKLVWNEMDAEDFWELRALWESSKGGCAEFTFSPPHESFAPNQDFVFVPGSFRAEKRSAVSYGAEVEIEKSRIQ